MYESVLKIEPSNPRPLARISAMYVSKNQPDLAAQRILGQIQKVPQSAAMYELLGQVYARQKSYPKAEQAFQKAISLDGNAFSAYTALARLYFEQKSFDRAQSEIEKLLKVNPRTGHVLIGVLYQAQNNNGKAKYHYREALKLDPGMIVAQNNLAWMLCEAGEDLDEALKLAQAARAQSDNPDIADTLGWIYYKRGAYPSALELFQECVKRAPENATYHYHLGMTYHKNGNRAAAKTALEQALKLSPNIPQAQEIKDILSKG